VYNARLLKADCHLQLGQPKDAVALLEPELSAHASDPAFAYLMGMALMQDGQNDRAAGFLDAILKQGDSAEAHVLMGVAKQAAGDFSEARQELEKAVELNPSLPLAHSLLGRAYLSTGDRERARTAFVRELALNPNDFDATLYLGVIQKEDRDFGAAQRSLERAIALRSTDLGAQYQLASLRLAQGETVAALDMLEQIVRAAPQFLEAHVSLATAYYRMQRKQDGDRERAIVARLTAEAQARQPGATPSPSPPQPQQQQEP
jgi:tetratricopeptide (TPR) repeat protein